VTLREPAISDRGILVAGSLLFDLAVSRGGQDSSFVLETVDPTYHTTPFFGNGAVSLVGTPLGTAPALSFAAGVYDHGPDDVPRIAVLAARNEINIFNRTWLNAAASDANNTRLVPK
jgi:hypothetical protein